MTNMENKEDASGSTLITNVDTTEQPTDAVAADNTYVEDSNTQMIDTTTNAASAQSEPMTESQ